MNTPWGPLSLLNYHDTEIAAEILSSDKHTLLEGLVVESLFDQIVESIPEATGNAITQLDVDTVVVDTGREKERWLVFVWVRSKSEGLGRYFIALERCFVPYYVMYSEGRFDAVRVSKGRKVGKSRALHELMYELSGGQMKPFEVAEAVRDKNRQKQAYWGYISSHYGDYLGDRVVLPRIFINCAIQPYFRNVWNLDRVLVVGEDVWVLEIKHKFPIDLYGLYFGINEGELSVLGMLAGANIRCLHTVLVKPYWTTKIGSMYLLGDMKMRERTALVAIVLGEEIIAKICKRPTYKSKNYTSANGKSEVSYKCVQAVEFVSLGLFSDKATDIAGRIAVLMKGNQLSPVNEAWLRRLRAVSKQ
ncbi:hypothetical protein [Chromobacterium vaccinii]|uniref:hypothetical protein n=1 Tax=Chromobacterium vaccinii TaxID=1108595 RepID=UPI001319E852|nr:hypothetical protein [Chromobacterium vaccinii]